MVSPKRWPKLPRKGFEWRGGPLTAVVALCFLLPGGAYAQYHSSITFRNGADEDALVKLIGPSTRMVAVPRNQTRAALEVPPGQYYIVVRYGDKEDNFAYSKGEPFQVEEYGDSYSQISITLYKVANGNYGTRPARKEDFDKSAAAPWRELGIFVYRATRNAHDSSSSPDWVNAFSS